MRLPRPSRRLLVQWGLILGACLLLTIVFAGQLVLSAEITWDVALRISGRDWLPWMVLAPLVVGLVHRFPIERPQRVQNAAVHLCGCVAAVLFCEFAANMIAPAGAPARQNRGSGSREFFLPGQGREPQPRRGPGLDRPMPGPGAQGRPVPLWRNAMWMRARFAVPVYWVIVSLAHALMYQRRSLERERKAAELSAGLAQARLHALRMQLHPHFLFNALNAISTLIHKDPQAADDMIANLSALLRLALDTSDLQEVPLRRELELLDCYLAIEKQRLGDRLSIEREIDAGTLDALVPSLVLQPLVENAIRHGIEPRREPGIVRLRAERRDGRLRLQVIDDGVGLQPTHSGEGRQGIGLSNTRARLQELYGDKGILSLGSGTGRGLVAELEIPFRKTPLSQPAPTQNPV